MSSVQVIRLTTKREMDRFVSFPRSLYKNYVQYVPDMDSEVRGFFNPKKNSDLEFADVQPFLAYKDGKVVGRIVGVVSRKSNAAWDKHIVRFTYLDFIDDREVSRALIDAVEQWGREKGMDEIQGPMGITDFDKEGMLIEDFDLQGCFMEFWNPPYYKLHMEEMGFDKAADWLQIRFEVPKEIPPRFQRVADYSKQEFGVHLVHKTRKDIYDVYGEKIFNLLKLLFSKELCLQDLKE